jgi:hypothetical protein
MEAFFSTVKSEIGEWFAGHADAKVDLCDYLKVFYNQRRRHSAAGRMSRVTKPSTGSDQAQTVTPGGWQAGAGADFGFRADFGGLSARRPFLCGRRVWRGSALGLGGRSN